jgi:hypothetical protein
LQENLDVLAVDMPPDSQTLEYHQNPACRIPRRLCGVAEKIGMALFQSNLWAPAFQLAAFIEWAEASSKYAQINFSCEKVWYYYTYLASRPCRER